MKKDNTRFAFLGTCFVMLFALLLGRILYVLAVKKDEILSQTKTNLQHKIKKLRGNIYTNDGILLATSIRGFEIYKKAGQILTKKDIKKLKKIGISITPELNKKRKLIYKFINPYQQEKLKKLPVRKKLEIIPTQKRIYYRKNIYAPLIGFLNYEKKGAAGIEYYFDDILSEIKKVKTLEIDLSGNLLLTKNPEILYAKCSDVYLTIENPVQEFLYEQIKNTVEKFHGKKGYGIVINARRGEILGFVSYEKEQKKFYMKNPLIGDAFEPGSTFKIVTVSAALQEKIVTPFDKFYCGEGQFRFPTITVRDHEPYEWLTVAEIIQHSSNIGICKIAEKLGKQKLYFYARAFGFGNYTGISLPAESRGVLRRIKNWSETSLYCTSFGQEVSATPLQIAQAFSVIANNGLLIAPKLIKKIVASSGRTLYQSKKSVVRKVISPETAKTVKELLLNVTENGTAIRAKIKGWKICAKTGTAQKFDASIGKYSNEKYFASLGGFLPMENSRFVIFIGVDEPEKFYYGGLVCAKAFKKTAQFLIDYYGIPPDEKEPQMLVKK